MLNILGHQSRIASFLLPRLSWRGSPSANGGWGGLKIADRCLYVIQTLTQLKRARKCCLGARSLTFAWHVWIYTRLSVESGHTFHFRANLQSLAYQVFDCGTVLTLRGDTGVLVCLDWHLGESLGATACELAWSARSSFTRVWNLCVSYEQESSGASWPVLPRDAKLAASSSWDYTRMIVVACILSYTLISIANLPSLFGERQLGFMFFQLHAPRSLTLLAGVRFERVGLSW